MPFVSARHPRVDEYFEEYLGCVRTVCLCLEDVYGKPPPPIMPAAILVRLLVNQAYLAPFFVQIIPKLLLAAFIEELLQKIHGLLRRPSRGAFEKAMGTVFAAGSSDIAFPAQIVAAVIALRAACMMK